MAHYSNAPSFTTPTRSLRHNVPPKWAGPRIWHVSPHTPRPRAGLSSTHRPLQHRSPGSTLHLGTLADWFRDCGRKVAIEPRYQVTQLSFIHQHGIKEKKIEIENHSCCVVLTITARPSTTPTGRSTPAPDRLRCGMVPGWLHLHQHRWAVLVVVPAVVELLPHLLITHGH